MNEYRISIRRRRILLRILFWFTLAMNIVIGELFVRNILPDQRTFTDLANNFSRIVYFGFLIYLGFAIHNCTKLLQNEASLKEKYIASRDERSLFIREKVNRIAFDVFFAVLFCATFIASLINMAVFHTLVAVLAFVVILKAVLQVYMERKY